MTTEVLTPAPPYMVTVAGPYAIPHPYQGADELVVAVRLGEVSVTLVLGDDYTVSPAEELTGTGGDLTLSGPALALYAGWVLTIVRETALEQGWQGVTGPREKGLERQLDRIVQAQQDQTAEVGRGLHLPIGSAVSRLIVPPAPGKALIMNEAGTAFKEGPDAAQIAAAAAASEALLGNLTGLIPASPEYYGWTGGDGFAAFQAMFAAGRDTQVREAGSVAFGSNVTMTIPGGRKHSLAKAQFVVTGNYGTSNFGLTVGAGAEIDVLRVHVAAGVTDIDRWLYLEAGARIREIVLTADNPTGVVDAASDGFVRIGGDDVRIEALSARNIDKVLYANGRAGLHLGRAEIDGICQGLHLIGCTDFFIGSAASRRTSANAAFTPGENLLTMENCSNGKVLMALARDTGEHGIYVSEACTDIIFGHVRTERTGKCGFKARASTTPSSRIGIGSLTVVDACWANTPATNEDGLRIEYSNDFTIGALSVHCLGQSVSCYDGIYLNGVDGLTIGTAAIRDCANAIMRIEDLLGANQRIQIPALEGWNAPKGIYVDHLANGSNFRNNYIAGRLNQITGDAVTILGGPTMAPSASFISLRMSEIGGANNVGPSDTDIHLDLTEVF